MVCDENNNDIEIFDIDCNPMDYFQYISGSYSDQGYLESLLFTTHMEIKYEFGEKSLNCTKFNLNISSRELPIILFGEYITKKGFLNKYLKLLIIT